MIQGGGGRNDKKSLNTGFTRGVVCRGAAGGLGQPIQSVLATSVDLFVLMVQCTQVMSQSKRDIMKSRA